MAKKEQSTPMQIFDMVCEVLRTTGLQHNYNKNELVVVCSYAGAKSAHQFVMKVDKERELIMFGEQLQIKVKDDKKDDMAKAVCVANGHIGMGRFLYDLDSTISYEIIQSYSGCVINPVFIQRTLVMFLTTLERYESRFELLNKGKIDVENFYKANDDK